MADIKIRMAALICTAAFLVGCNLSSKKKTTKHDGKTGHYHAVASQIEYPDIKRKILTPAIGALEPRSVNDQPPDEF